MLICKQDKNVWACLLCMQYNLILSTIQCLWAYVSQYIRPTVCPPVYKLTCWFISSFYTTKFSKLRLVKLLTCNCGMGDTRIVWMCMCVLRVFTITTIYDVKLFAISVTSNDARNRNHLTNQPFGYPNHKWNFINLSENSMMTTTMLCSITPQSSMEKDSRMVGV